MWNKVGLSLPAAARLLQVACLLRVVPFPRLLRWLALDAALPVASPDAVTLAQDRVRWAHRLLPLAPNCLLDALTAAVLLRSDGCGIPLIIGVRRSDGTFQAHAWLGEAKPDTTGFEIIWHTPDFRA
jgi:hypothetical protein